MQQKVSPHLTDVASPDPWSAWVRSPGGRYVTAWEQEQFDLAVSDVFGFHAIQLGFGELRSLRANRIANRVLALRPDEDAEAFGEPEGSACELPTADAGAAAGESGRPIVRPLLRLANFEELPFAENSIDLLVLPHVLERSADPHQVLREVSRVLRPEGRVVVSGFNPISLWGAREAIGSPFSRSILPGPQHMISLPRLRDWLGLLSFDPQPGRYGCYRPPTRSQRSLERLAFLERMGDRWWPICGAVYLLSAVKRVRSMRLVGPAWKSDAHRARPVVVAASPRFQAAGADAIRPAPDTDSRGSAATESRCRMTERV